MKVCRGLNLSFPSLEVKDIMNKAKGPRTAASPSPGDLMESVKYHPDLPNQRLWGGLCPGGGGGGSLNKLPK